MERLLFRFRELVRRPSKREIQPSQRMPHERSVTARARRQGASPPQVLLRSLAGCAADRRTCAPRPRSCACRRRCPSSSAYEARALVPPLAGSGGECAQTSTCSACSRVFLFWAAPNHLTPPDDKLIITPGYASSHPLSKIRTCGRVSW